jgi:glutamate synthase domain-containing protein 2/glutamate synthase domain-containing protein 1/glutamate synthase domain-containing protein 3
VSGVDRLRALYPNIPAHEWTRGSCGIGFLANTDGQPTRDVVRQAIAASGRLAHRGAETRRDDGDAGTSDGAGILFSLHAPFFAEAFGAPLPTGDVYPFGLGMFFLPAAAAEAALAKALILQAVGRSGLPVLGWRELPVAREILGARARESCPVVAQVLVQRPHELPVAAFEAGLFRARKRIERRAAALGIRLHISSFSAHSVIYKGLFRATQVAEFYHADLGSARFLAAAAVYHQRYATNTLPDWALAQPFRRLCHNGEINTLLGNRAWTMARERALSPTLRRRLSPILGEGSDSAQLDRLLEAITIQGVSPVQALLGLVPEAHEAVPDLHEQMRAWYRLQQATREPWDGPAGLLYYDGRWLIAHLDRNGLRPLFVQERCGAGGPRQVMVASEQGVAEWPNEEVTSTGQLGPGELLALDMQSGRCYHDKEIKAELIGLTSDWQSQAEHHVLVGGTDPYRRPALDDEAFTRVQIAAHVSQDDLTYFVLPMVREGKEAVWSMGDDSQLAPFVSRPRMLEDHLRQRFAQVTNPPIDPLRESLVFSTRVYLGKLDGFLGEPIAGRTIELDSPVLSGPRFSWITRQDDVAQLSTAFPLGEPGSARLAFEAALALLEENALAAVREGARVVILSDRLPRGQHQGGDDSSASSRLGGNADAPASDPRALMPAVDAEHAAIPMLLVVSRVHRRLIEAGLRTRVGLVTDTTAAWHEHHVACQLGFGADAVHPWMALEWAWRLSEREEGCRPDPQGERFRLVLHRGVVKVMSKMGICAVTSYTGAQLFEILGLDEEVVDHFFAGAAHWGEGLSLDDLVEDVVAAHAAAFGNRRPVVAAADHAHADAPEQAARATVPARSGAGGPGGFAPVATRDQGGKSGSPSLAEQGFVRYRKGGIPRAFEPRVFSTLPKVVQETQEEMACYVAHESRDPREFLAAFAEVLDPASWTRYAEWAAAINEREPIMVADRYAIVSDRPPIPLEEAEPTWQILDDREGWGRVYGGAMSWGALSDEAHGDIAVAMNRVGARSNTGEGGEPAHRYGTPANGGTKQLASARFGVTPQYLYHLQEWQIKMAQGAKPGEGGQLPGHKVSREIAEVRGADPGVTLISPPPHHDIYSIEDLAELMYELGQFNPRAHGNVKLVSETGVAIVAAGVAKGGAHTVHVSGHAGGTGASPLSSIKFAGLPWELGTQATHQILHANDLRDRVKLVVDGGIQTGLHAVRAFLLGAEAVGLGTALLVAEGCILARQCHLNTCPTGIATQSKQLRARYRGKPVHLVKYLLLFAEEIRRILAAMGYRSVQEIIGRTDLLRPREDVAGKAMRIHFDKELLGRPLTLQPRRPISTEISPLNRRILEDVRSGRGESPVSPTTLRYTVGNADRAVGATLAGEIVGLTGEQGLRQPIDIRLSGYAGQSLGFGAWGGMRLILEGRANDYVGKAMGRGALIAVRPPNDLGCPPESTALVGNTVGYGATGGRLFVNGRAGQRFMCRNSGAEAVVEGVGPHGCEYMTKGTVIVLGEIGLNFGAGMTGGVAYLLDGFAAEERRRLNTDYVRVEPLNEEEMSPDGPIHALIAEHHRWTGSPLAETILRYWEFYARHRFDRVVSIVERARVSDTDPLRLG